MFGRWFIKSMGQIWVVWEILKWSSIGEVFHLITSSSLKLESLNSGIEKWYWITFSCVLYWHCLRLHNTGYCKNRLDHSRMACNHWDQIWRVQIVSADTGHNLWLLPRFSYTDTLQYLLFNLHQAQLYIYISCIRFSSSPWQVTKEGLGKSPCSVRRCYPWIKTCAIYDKILMIITLCCDHIHMFREPSEGYLCVPLSQKSKTLKQSCHRWRISIFLWCQ